MNNNFSKLDYINSVEQHENMDTNVDLNRPKKFLTFPYPYMNGKLHLGHLYSLSKVDFYAYFKRLEGYNVLFPFAFHCTGMPISASAYKLKEELAGKKVDVSVVSILKGLGFEDVSPFTDPVHWIRVFPGFAIKSLKRFHAAIDWRRSFITTDINKYYDSFVRYQFNKLKRLGFLDFGKRYSIFCTIDKQACLDHDRRKGEGVKPMDVILRKITLNDKSTLLVRCKNLLPIEKCVFSVNCSIIKFSIRNLIYFAEETVYENLKYQINEIVLLEKIRPEKIQNMGVVIELIEKDINGKVVNIKNEQGKMITCDENAEYTKLLSLRNEEMILVESENFVKFQEPEDLVISRSGSKCVVALLDQWYIDYSQPEWKQKARKCIDSMVLHSDTRAKLEEALDWINKWGFSRSFGLGTRIPWDTQYLIDSLSDSTIYNALYTVKHFMFSDLEGKEELFPSSCLCDDVWSFIFGDIKQLPDSLIKHIVVLEKCKQSFEYFYPVDLRVSGKDLIGNHLIFFIFNHVALFDEKYWPKRIFTNGHLMLNSAKMSKSDGNYLTVEDALTKFGASATRMCLADCGDSNEDANFVEAVANGFVLKLFKLTKSVEEITDSTINIDHLNAKYLDGIVEEQKDYHEFINKYFIQQVSRNIKMCLQNHEEMIYRDVLKYGYFENMHLIEFYQILGGKNNSLINYSYQSILQLMYPIIPSLAKYLINMKFNGNITVPEVYGEETDCIEAVEHVKALCSKIISCKRNFTAVEVGVTKSYSVWKKECMEIVNACTSKNEIISNVNSVFDTYKVHKGKGMLFCMDYFVNKDKYYVKFDEMRVIELLREYIQTIVKLDVKVIESDQGDPLLPVLKFK